MLSKINNAVKFGKKQGGFGIEILYPGTIVPDADDTGIATIGRIDQAIVTPGTLIPMHPHWDDEILTYLRKGKVKHLDSEGTTDEISNTTLMNAGARFYHEERVLEEGGVLEGLQIFIRPETEGLKPRVQFHDLAEAFSMNQWRKLAGKGDEYPLEIRSNTWIQDIQLTEGITQYLLQLPIQNSTILFYVFEGEVEVNNNIVLKTGESILIERESPAFHALQKSDVVLFITDKNAPYFAGGMYSGNQPNRR
jgi:hypothetical protein